MDHFAGPDVSVKDTSGTSPRVAKGDMSSAAGALNRYL